MQQASVTDSAWLTRLDQLIGRLLWIRERPASTQPLNPQRAERAFGASLVFSGVRCILQYVVLPFLLPLIGVAADAAVSISLAINILAVVLIFYSLRRFWQIRYHYRWQYLGVAGFALILLSAFILLDFQVISGLSFIAF
jgi:hypothetical protein